VKTFYRIAAVAALVGAGWIDAAAAGVPTAASDAQRLLVNASPWDDVPSPVGPAPLVRDAFATTYQGRGGYPLAGPINAARGNDALAAALGPPMAFGAPPEPSSWVLMIFGLALVGFTLRRRHRLPNVSS
jgi:hypothetical protein